MWMFNVYSYEWTFILFFFYFSLEFNQANEKRAEHSGNAPFPFALLFTLNNFRPQRSLNSWSHGHQMGSCGSKQNLLKDRDIKGKKVN